MIPISLSGGTVMAVFLMAVIVLGYVVIWAIWHFFFREAGDHVPDERPMTVPQKPHDSARTGPQATARAAQALGRAIGDGEASTGSRSDHDAPADASDAPRAARHSASSSADDRQA